jgi:hypothetical protein
MNFLPKSDQIIVMFHRGYQDLLHRGPLCVAGSNGILPVRECDVAIREEIHNDHGPFVLSVNMPGRVIV